MFLKHRINGALLCLLCCLLCSDGEEVHRLQELEGNTVTLHAGRTGVQSDAQIFWFYRSKGTEINIVKSLVVRGETVTDYNRERLQLDRNSGSLAIRNISREDSGVYKLQIIAEASSVWSYSVNVYAPVSTPVIYNNTEQRSGHLDDVKSCLLLCSVENGKDVNLSWYEEKKKIFSINNSDSSERLYLPLNVTVPNSYTCVAANPVTKQTTQLNMVEFCRSITGLSKEDHRKMLAAILTSAGLIALSLILFAFYWKKKKKQQVTEDIETTYAEVKIARHNSKEPKKSKEAHEVNSSREKNVQDQSNSVVYESVNKKF